MGAHVRVDAMREDDVPSVAAMDGPTQMNEGHVRDEMARPWSRLWVAREEGAGVVAFVVAWHVADELHVLNVATREDRRRRGIGRTLLGEVVGYARAHRMKHVLLEVRRSNVAAIALYRGAGFFAMGVRARYYPDDEDAVEMVLLLDAETGAVVAHADEVRLDG
ncbi:MAG TPA: ribosomal protein S18-alanine N-acetyltransferase [Polyangiaceae bacterium]